MLVGAPILVIWSSIYDPFEVVPLTHASLFALLPFSWLFMLSIASARGTKKTLPETPIADADADHVQRRSIWFLCGRVVPGSRMNYATAPIRPRCRYALLDWPASAPPSRTRSRHRRLPDGHRSVPCRWPLRLRATDFRTATGFRAGQPRWRLILHTPAKTGLMSGDRRAQCGSPATPPPALPTTYLVVGDGGS
jgi:hypothetical protein